MAWLSLFFVTIVVYTPVVGLGHRLVGQDLVAHFSLVTLRIPFTGALRLFAYSITSWVALWGGLLLLEGVTGQNLLLRLGLRRDLVYAFRPRVSSSLARDLAMATVAVALVKLIALFLLGLALGALVSGVVGRVAASLSIEIAPEFVSFATQWVEDRTGDLLGIDISPVWVSLSLLVLLADRAHRWEQRYRCGIDLARNRRQRREVHLSHGRLVAGRVESTTGRSSIARPGP